MSEASAPRNTSPTLENTPEDDEATRNPEDDARTTRQARSAFDTDLSFGLPGDFFKHMRLARREILLAARTLLDARIAALEEEAGERPSRVQRINIE